jgi:hypothetical protein
VHARDGSTLGFIFMQNTHLDKRTLREWYGGSLCAVPLRALRLRAQIPRKHGARFATTTPPVAEVSLCWRPRRSGVDSLGGVGAVQNREFSVATVPLRSALLVLGSHPYGQLFSVALQSCVRLKLICRQVIYELCGVELDFDKLGKLVPKDAGACASAGEPARRLVAR